MLLIRVVTVMLMAAIGVLSLTPDREDPGTSAFVWVVHLTPSIVQKTLHVLLYAVLCAAWFASLNTIESERARGMVAVVVTVGYGALLEWLQTFVPGRFGSLTDVILNTIGAVVGLVVAGNALRPSQTGLDP